MSQRTGIEWTDATWNPVVGCTKVSQGCKHCYAKQLHDQRHEAYQEGKRVPAQYAHPFETVQLMPQRLLDPAGWRTPRRVFVNSVSDLFHEDVPVGFIRQVFTTMHRVPWHTYQILTKRPARMLEVLRGFESDPIACEFMERWPLPNVWLGVSVENQAAARERIPRLLEAPAAVRFLSCEPLLGPVDLRRIDVPVAGAGSSLPAAPPAWRRYDALTGFVGSVDHKGYCVGHAAQGVVHWVIAGGESGRDARPMHPAWVRGLRDQCAGAGVPFFFKQWGNWSPLGPLADEAHSHTWAVRLDGSTFAYSAAPLEGRRWVLERAGDQPWCAVDAPPVAEQIAPAGKRRAGRELDGRTWDAFPHSTT